MLRDFDSLIIDLENGIKGDIVDRRGRSLREWNYLSKRVRHTDSAQFQVCKSVVKGRPGRHISVVKVYHERILQRESHVIFGPYRENKIINGISQLSRELGLLAAMKGTPHIVELEKVCFSGNSCRVFTQFGGLPIMRYVESIPCYSAYILNRLGVSLYNLTPEESPMVFTESDALTCMRQLLSALVYLRKERIIHKDVKPENVLLNFPVCQWRHAGENFKLRGSEWKHDRPIHVTLIDFNISEYEPNGRIYDAGGTSLFSPPEVFCLYNEENGIDGFARDAWSAGMLGYCLLAGFHPLPVVQTSIEYQLNLIKMRDEEQVIRLPEQACREIPQLREAIEGLLILVPEKRLTAESALNLLSECRESNHSPL